MITTTVISSIVSAIAGLGGGIATLKKLQSYYGELKEIPKNKWIQLLVGVEHLWKNYVTKDFNEYKIIKNKLREAYPILTDIVHDVENDVKLNTKTIKVESVDIERKIKLLKQQLGIWE